MATKWWQPRVNQVDDMDCGLFYDTQYLEYMAVNDRITDELERS
jgi:hypothetical protein